MPKQITPNKPDPLQENKGRPRCPTCGRELVKMQIQIGQVAFTGFFCDCELQPPGIYAAIVRAREWDDQVLIFEVEVIDR